MYHIQNKLMLIVQVSHKEALKTMLWTTNENGNKCIGTSCASVFPSKSCPIPTWKCVTCPSPTPCAKSWNSLSNAMQKYLNQKDYKDSRSLFTTIFSRANASLADHTKPARNILIVLSGGAAIRNRSSKHT